METKHVIKMLELIRKDVAVMTKSHFPVTYLVLPCVESGA